MDATYSIDFFNWKHQENPFGKSFGLLALEGEKIIGLRMFMFWEFNLPKGKIKAIRPVDTVTDVNFRGKGIFKKLTLDGLQNISGEYEIIFNTPNKKSLPGYLKMGWKPKNNLNFFRVGLINPFVKSVNYVSVLIDQVKLEKENSTSYNGTALSIKFLKWRYKDPIYQIAHFSSEKCFIIYKKIKIYNIPSLILYEFIGGEKGESVILNSLARKIKTPLVYYYGCDLKNGKFLFSLKRKMPVVVVKNDKHLISDVLNFSLGDLESKL